MPATSLRSRLQLWRCAEVGRSPQVTGQIWIRGAGRIRLGDRVRFDAADAPVELHAGPGAEIVIGDDVAISGGTSIEAQESVTIGDRCRIEAFSKILDNHFHPLQGDRRVRPPSAPVVVEADTSIGCRAIILPGARVPRGAVVPPGAVIRGPASAAANRPAEDDGLSPERRTTSPILRALEVVRGDPIGATRRTLAILRARFLFRKCERGARLYAGGRVRVVNEGRILIGERAAFVGGMIPTDLICRPGARLEVGERSVFNYGVSIEAHASVRIGRRCMLASSVRICDRGPHGVAPIVILDDVWIAHGATVEPGVTIGEGSVVSAGSVVKRDVPPRSLAAGNPARCLSLELAAPRASRID